MLQKIEKPERVVLQAITRYACGPDGFATVPRIVQSLNNVIEPFLRNV